MTLPPPRTTLFPYTTLFRSPEYATFTNRVFDRTFVDNAEELDGESVTALRKLSAAKNIALIAGVNEPAGAGKIFNTLVGIHSGEIVATYRKVHLYDAFGNQESQWVTPGEIEPPELLELNGLKRSEERRVGKEWRARGGHGSRRRHTRWPRDWSSDVCSSDLRRG